MLTLIIRWVARVSGTLVAVALVFSISAHLINDGTVSSDPLILTDVLQIIFYHICLPIGFLIALKWELLGGLIAVGGLIGFHIIRPDLILDPMMDGLAAPSFLYLIAWGLSRTLTPTNT